METDEDEILDSFFCPITFEMMCHPVICVDGHSYEKAAILDWFKLGKIESPRTNAPLASTSVTPNHALKIAIQAWCSRPVASPGESGGKEEPSSDHEQNDEPDGSPNNAGYKKNKKKKKKKKASGPVQLSYEEFKKTLLCPITKTFMEDPVVWADGFSYERKAIEEQLSNGHMESIKSGQKMLHKNLVPNIQLRQVIQVWLEFSACKGKEVAVVIEKARRETLMSEAFKRELASEEKEELLSKLETAEDVVQSGLTPACLRRLVDNNPRVAVDCLIKLAPSSQIPLYLTMLVDRKSVV